MVEGTDEHIGVIEEETTDSFTLNHVFTFAKQPTENGLSVSIMPFVFNSCKIKKVVLMKNKLYWYTEDIDKDFKQKYTASLSGLVVAGADTIDKIKKNNIVDLNSFKK
ncbi:MAG: hypothetical protein PHW93_06765 [Candidatus Methanomethylophilaceae archaeon]|nr:hypothetical protein [Candidatus Methanomethylophilaceae archaeon]